MLLMGHGKYLDSDNASYDLYANIISKSWLLLKTKKKVVTDKMYIDYLRSMRFLFSFHHE